MNPLLNDDRGARSRNPSDKRSSTGRTRDYVRIYKACDACKRKKTRCILDTPDESRSACRKCKRERRPCSLSEQSASPVARSEEPPAHKDGGGAAGHDPGEAMLWDPPPATPETLSQFLASTKTPSVSTGRTSQRVQHGRIPDFRSMAAPTDIEAAENDNVVIASISNAGDTMKVLQRPSGHQEEPGRYIDGDETDFMESPRAQRSRAIGPIISALSDPSSELLRLWNSLRFVRMGWLTAREAVSYIDL